MLIEFHLSYVKVSWVHCEISYAGTDVDTPAILYAFFPTECKWSYKKIPHFWRMLAIYLTLRKKKYFI